MALFLFFLSVDIFPTIRFIIKLISLALLSISIRFNAFFVLDHTKWWKSISKQIAYRFCSFLAMLCVCTHVRFIHKTLSRYCMSCTDTVLSTIFIQQLVYCLFFIIISIICTHLFLHFRFAPPSNLDTGLCCLWLMAEEMENQIKRKLKMTLCCTNAWHFRLQYVAAPYRNGK